MAKHVHSHQERSAVVLCLFPQWGPTPCDCMDCSPPASSVHGDSPGKHTGSQLPCPSPGDLPNPGIKPQSPPLRVDSLPAESLGKPKNTAAGSLSRLQGTFLTQELNQVSSIAGRFFTDCVDHNKLWEILQGMRITCSQVKKQQLEPDMEQETHSKLGKEYVKAVCCHLLF